MAETFSFSKGEKEAQLPRDPGRDEKGFGPIISYPCKFGMMKGMCL